MKSLRIILFLLIGIQTNFTSKAQTVVKMRKQAGVSVISCKVNGLKLDFIFDTGASDVSISFTEVLFMLKNGYLSKDDIIGTNKYYNADGDLNEGLEVILREIDIEGRKMFNIKASIVKNLKAPLLLGQSAISQLGKIELDLDNNTLTILSNKSDIKAAKVSTVKIGTQVWMSQNLDVSFFRNGDLIPQIKSQEEWMEAAKNGKPAWCYYDNNPINGKNVGKLYNWYAVNDIRGLAPEGYHIPTKAEWETLLKFYGKGWEKIMGKGWKDEKNENMASIGFLALPSGCRGIKGFSRMLGEKYNLTAQWWSSDENRESDSAKYFLERFGEESAFACQLWLYNLSISTNIKSFGNSVRCIKD
jgi:uncharacterized protein (TIGR02145 family)